MLTEVGTAYCAAVESPKRPECALYACPSFTVPRVLTVLTSSLQNRTAGPCSGHVLSRSPFTAAVEDQLKRTNLPH